MSRGGGPQTQKAYGTRGGGGEDSCLPELQKGEVMLTKFTKGRKSWGELGKARSRERLNSGCSGRGVWRAGRLRYEIGKGARLAVSRQQNRTAAYKERMALPGGTHIENRELFARSRGNLAKLLHTRFRGGDQTRSTVLQNERIKEP